MTSSPVRAWVLWTRGPRGPQAALIQNRGIPPMLTETERSEGVAEPIPLEEPDDTMLPLQAIARLYPLPVAVHERGPGKP